MTRTFTQTRFIAGALGVLLCLPLAASVSFSQIAAGKGRFIGNALSTAVRPDFAVYWNQVTPGNAGKWGSVEGSQDSYYWTPLDDIYNYAMVNRFPYKHHTLVWGNQQPDWIASLDSASQRAQVEEWIHLVGDRYTAMSFVDVVNEPFHTPLPSYMNALGGAGKTGWDWVVTAFTWARQYCLRGVKLLLNEYNVLQDNAVTSTYLRLIDTLRVRGLIDGIGVQGHYFEFKSYAGAPNTYTYSVATLKSNLDRLVATGLPVYISEFDINEANDSTQLVNYKTYFPLFWETPGVKGITLWGYVQGDTWQQNGYLVRSNGTERPALQWLRKYVASPLPPALMSPLGNVVVARNPLLVWRPSATALSYRVQVAADLQFATMAADTTTSDTLARISPLPAHTRHYWRVSAVNDSGASSPSTVGVFTTDDQITGVTDLATVLDHSVLFQNHPNPFNPVTTIQFTLASRQWTVVTVYDVMGREVATLANDVMGPGTYSVRFDGTHLASGVYYYRMHAGSFAATRMLVLVR